MPDAGNLAALLYRLRNEYNGSAYHSIVRTIRLIVPFLDDFDLEPTGPNKQEIILNWREKGSDQIFGPHQLSDGTLRAICLVTLLLQPEDELPDLIIVDEPELGLHLLAQEKARDVFFTTMIDLYAIHADFPGLNESEKLHRFPKERVETLERAFADDIGDPRFIPYIQLHEYEAYLFSDPAKFGVFYNHHEKEISELTEIADKTTPELINDGQHTAPSKRIIAVLPDYKGAKSVVGPQVAELIGLDMIRSRCPHFDAWLSRLEQLTICYA